jgi:prepilin-type N-terminal cleavage/methylation domain-containing protein
MKTGESIRPGFRGGQPVEMQPGRAIPAGVCPPKTNAAAFTLVEVMVALAISTIMLVTVFSGFTLGWAVIHTSRDDLRATQILTQKIESLRLLTWDELASCPTNFTDTYDPTTANGSGTFYSGTIFIGAATNIVGSASYKDQVHLITVSLLWTNSYGNRALVHSRSMQTLSAMNGMQNYLWGMHP